MPFQMALDEILFRRRMEGELSSPVLRFYFSSEPWMTVGYSHPEREKGEGEIGVQSPSHSFTSSPIPVCKRITGGGQVLHGKDLLFSLAARKEDDESFTSVRVSYWKIHEAVKNAFEKAGERARFYRCDEKLPRGGECFVYPIATDLELDQKKIAGGAQKRSSGALLHQESLQLPSRIEPFGFMEKVKHAFETQFGIILQDLPCDPEILEKAKYLASEKYENINMLASAKFDSSSGDAGRKRESRKFNLQMDPR